MKVVVGKHLPYFLEMLKEIYLILSRDDIILPNFQNLKCVKIPKKKIREKCKLPKFQFPEENKITENVYS